MNEFINADDSRLAADKANKEVFVTLTGPRTGREFSMREQTYGVLDSDPESPLSCVSVANSSLSIDLWKGCAWQCSYCHVQGSIQDLDQDSLTMPNRPMQRANFTSEEIIDALIEHPFFEPDLSVLSIGTASTEPFAGGKIADSTFEVMEYVKEKGLKNPFWIVTKAGFPKGYEDRLKEIVDHGNSVMISICWANNPKDIEPVQTNRFRNIEKAHDAGATVSWYLRPLAEGWSTDSETLHETFNHARKYKDSIDMIIPGGLRWTDGIEYGVSEVRGLEMPDIPHDDNVKDLSDETWALIDDLSATHFPNVPVYRRSSCGLSKMNEAPNHNLVQLQDSSACLSSECPVAQRDICGSYTVPSKDVLQSRLGNIGLGHIQVNAIDASGRVETSPGRDTMTFALRHMIEIATARSHE